MSKKNVIDETVEQAVETSENFAEELAKQEENTTASEPVSKQPEQVIVKKGGTGIALLALLVALGIGGAGYYFGSQKLVEESASSYCPIRTRAIFLFEPNCRASISNSTFGK